MDKRVAITDSNLGPVVSLLSWIMAASVIIAVFTKFILSSIVHGKRITENTALFLATGFSIGFTVALSMAAHHGIGQHQNTLSRQDLEVVQKAIYSANILFILVSACVQASVLIFLYDITPVVFHHVLIIIVGVVILVSSVPFLFVALFPCHLPDAWEILGDQCIHQLSFWQAFAGVNLLVESALVLLPIIMVYPLIMERRRKAIVISGFAARLTVIAAFAVQIHQAHVLRAHSHDQTFHAWKYYVAIIFVQGLSIITVCIPYIRNLLLGMESGMIQTGHFRLPSRRSTEAEISLHFFQSNK